LSIRTQKVQPLMKKLEQISARMRELEREVERLRLEPRSCREDLANSEKELHDLMLMTLEEPAYLRKRVELDEKRFGEYEQAKRCRNCATSRRSCCRRWAASRRSRSRRRRRTSASRRRAG